MGKHAFLSASSSHRWLECPPSAKLCAEQEDRASPYAQQGTDCHELCAYLVEKSLGKDVTDPTRITTRRCGTARKAIVLMSMSRSRRQRSIARIRRC